ncbi:lysophospholipase [Aspergillus ibericus CBS 121593]|uniref:Lysophospholipase n=1 Tax=Aspergillus ibericus CBS 121593 TaxID=1448316 RepID=A0A395GJX0_9EURO|nr:lysophospholipase [Aspergillus ibericus CBS 121593]RAK95077.1 lysophospholipase [Aspergillus ibericus CBS 121593]
MWFLLVTAVAAVAATQDLPQGYAPVPVSCPDNLQWVRPAVGLSQDEASWVEGRKKVILNSLDAYLDRLELEDFDRQEYVSRLDQTSQTPILGLAISGGGFGSAFTGTGVIRAFDDRLMEANEQRTGGILQSLTYISGLSGGSWPTVSFPSYGFPTADEIVDYWKPEIDRLLTVKNNTADAATGDTLFEQIATKFLAGFDIGVGDYLGRGYAYEFIPGESGGISTTFSGIRNLSQFITHEMPMPIIHLASVESGDPEYDGLLEPRANGTIFDVTPFEFGAWSGSVRAFTPTEWMGNQLSRGAPVNESTCWRGFDRSSFLIGSSANAFNFWYLETISNGTLGQFAKRSSKNNLAKRLTPPSDLDELVDAFKESFDLHLTDITYSTYPNPFANLSSSSGNAHTSPDLNLVDGSETGQTIPLWGQIQPARNVDFIIAWDDSQDADPYDWNNGTNLYNTYTAAKAAGLPFPVIPPVKTMMNLNYTIHPQLFGCDANLTTTGDDRAPIVLYLANAPYSAYTNFSFWQTSTSREQMNEIFVNSFDIVTQANGTWDAEWPACIGCAAVDRSLARIGMERTNQCERCFEKYCWNGELDERDPGEMDPTLVLDPGVGFDEWNATHPF